MTVFFFQWFPEVKHFCLNIPVILIGCKTDLRKDKECVRKLKAMNLAPITYAQVKTYTRGKRKNKQVMSFFVYFPK